LSLAAAVHAHTTGEELRGHSEAEQAPQGLNATHTCVFYQEQLSSMPLPSAAAQQREQQQQAGASCACSSSSHYSAAELLLAAGTR
jgi:hypothetical protein